jgi:hypothetical protein
MNLLFAALYDLIFSKVTQMGYLIPDRRGRTVSVLFVEFQGVPCECKNDCLPHT